ncbi:MAG: succinate dehydrogenase, hydrophobic membrane anchor protein, partial [Chloroflexota bacterium]|nr:succinate dehydrogenase, hydrophobic membrane anchor protein [Chloroflexota bacterium]
MATANFKGGGTGIGVTTPGSDRLVWYFLRVSGLVLVVFALGHLFVTHYLNVPSDTTFDFVSARWANPLWRSFDLVLLISALWHGLIGLRYSVTDYIRAPGWRVAGYSAIWVVGLLFTVVGSVTILSFNEAASRDNT